MKKITIKLKNKNFNNELKLKSNKFKDLKYFSLKNSFKDQVVTDGSISLANLFELAVFFKKIGWRVISACFSRRGKLSSRLRFLGTFTKHLFRLKNNHGEEFVVKYLKACQLAVQKCIAGTPVSSLVEIAGEGPWPRLGHGLPVIIPVYDRRLIRQGSPSIIRFWLTLFSLYRIIRLDVKHYKLNTITDPFSGDFDKTNQIGSNLKTLSMKFLSDSFRISDQQKGLLLLESSSPNAPTSWSGLIPSYKMLQETGLNRSLELLMRSFKLDSLSNLYTTLRLVSDATPWIKSVGHMSDCPTPGKLSTKIEPAGKVRVFAMVDILTQSVLYPLHKAIFRSLQTFPNDATFDQRGAVKRCLAKSLLYNCSYGYDLSAATDRLPISIQMMILSPLIGEQEAVAWRSLLVDRIYTLKEEKTFSSYKYSVGQPMGALSSFAMLALTHHLIVQLAARRSGVVLPTSNCWYEGYELLGDDILIFDKIVAEEYLIIMNDLGVPINLAKSVVAPNKPVFEFAKVTGFYGKDVSAISWKGFLSQTSLMGRANLAFSLMTRPLGIVNLFSWLDSWTKVKGKDNNVTLLAIWTMFSNKFISKADSLQCIITSEVPVRRIYQHILMNAKYTFIKSNIMNILKGRPVVSYQSESVKDLWFRERTWLCVELSKKLTMFEHSFETYTATESLVRDMVIYMIPQAPLHTLRIDSLSVKMDSLFEEACNALFFSLFVMIRQKFDDYTIDKGRGLDGDQLFEHLLDQTDRMDRTKELMLLVERAKRKDTEGGTPKEVVGTPQILRLVKTYQKIKRNKVFTSFF
jgi:hypothetical protein